jgi:hypothetical protein
MGAVAYGAKGFDAGPWMGCARAGCAAREMRIESAQKGDIWGYILRWVMALVVD